MKAVLRSIKPYWFYLICERKKRTEIGKDMPKAADWNKVVELYCSKDMRSFSRIPKEFQNKYRPFIGKVGARFVCDKIDRIEIRHFSEIGHFNVYCSVSENPNDNWRKESCLTESEIVEYGKLAPIFGWHISDLKIYDEPKELGEFDFPCTLKTLCEVCRFSINEETVFGGVTIGCDRRLHRPPQSWQYIEGER